MLYSYPNSLPFSSKTYEICLVILWLHAVKCSFNISLNCWIWLSKTIRCKESKTGDWHHIHLKNTGDAIHALLPPCNTVTSQSMITFYKKDLMLCNGLVLGADKSHFDTLDYYILLTFCKLQKDNQLFALNKVILTGLIIINITCLLPENDN